MNICEESRFLAAPANLAKESSHPVQDPESSFGGETTDNGSWETYWIDLGGEG